MIISLLGLNGAGIQTSLWKKCQFRPKLVQYITLVYHPPVVRGSAAFYRSTARLRVVLRTATRMLEACLEALTTLEWLDKP